MLASALKSSPLVVTFCDRHYIPILANWLAFAQRIAHYNIHVYCLDIETFNFVQDAGLSSEHIAWDGSFKGLWAKRIQIFADLVESGRSILHTDTDCIWLRDPVAGGFGDGADFVFSQGTIHPASTHAKLGFVLCCGLFRVNPGTVPAHFLRRLATHVKRSGDDQASVNELLYSDGTIWEHSDSPNYRLRFNGQTFSCWTEVLRGRCLSSKITVDLVPHCLVQRIPDPISNDKYVVAKHFFSAKEARKKLAEFRHFGLLAIRSDWETLPQEATLDDFFMNS